MISPGAIVRLFKHGDVAWVVHSGMPDGRFKCISKAVDHRGRAVLSSRTAGEGDMVLIKDAPAYAAGDPVERNGVQHTVARDLGADVELIVPASRRPLTGGGHLHIAAGNTTIITKCELVLEELR